MPNQARPDGALVSLQAHRQEGLSHATDWQLGMELLARLRSGKQPWAGSQLGWLGAQLQFALRNATDFHDNRFARRRYLDLYGVSRANVKTQLPLEGATFVDLGCGGVNPLGLLFVFLALGARRGIGVDLDEIQDVAQATHALADVAAQLLLDSRGIAWDREISREQILRNISSFDLARLRHGDPAGIDLTRLRFCRDSIYSMSIGDAEADVVMSNAFLEHIPDVQRGAREIARITKPGGYTVHLIDMSDHRRYVGEHGPLHFLTEKEGDSFVAGSNRLRWPEFVEIFESEGFDIVEKSCLQPSGVTEEMRAGFVEPFRSMPLEHLDPLMFQFVGRRR